MMATPFKIDVKDKVIAITGGYGHLGAAATESLLAYGGIVYVLARDRNKFNEVYNALPELNDRLFFQKCDISQSSSIKEALDVININSGKLDVLINNAHYSKGRAPINLTDEEWVTGIDGVLSSAFRCIREAIPYLRQSKGSIINVSSMYGMVAPDFEIYNESPEYLNPPHYGTAKAGIIQLSKYYASYLGKDDITVNVITPGPFPKSIIQGNKNFIEKLKNKTVLKRIGQPEDIGGAFVFLASDAARYITGQNIVIDGGWTIV